MKRLQRSRIEGAQCGMALIECMMALLIFSVGLLGLLGLEARVMNISTDSENRSRASMLASEVASQMWLNNTVVPASTAYNNLILNAGDQTQGGLPGGVVTVAQIGTTNAADITVTWTEVSDVATGTQSTLTTRVILP